MWELFWFSIVANVSITGMNLSLMLNSVGFYQVCAASIIIIAQPNTYLPDLLFPAFFF
jgi:hypothetical protein